MAKADKNEQKAVELYISPDYFIKYSGGRPIACYPYYAGGSFYEMAGETVCNTDQHAKKTLWEKAHQHAIEIVARDKWEVMTTAYHKV